MVSHSRDRVRQITVILLAIVLCMEVFVGYCCGPYIVNAVENKNTTPWWGGAIVWYWNMPPDMSWIAGVHPKPKYVLLDPESGVLDNPWTRSDLERLKAAGIKVIGYVNIGFAEEWREYWDPEWSKENHPEWLFWTEHPDWEGEHFVKYWHPSAWKPGGWIDILKSEINKIVSLGFDGIILDNIDSYTAWENPEEWGLEDILPRVENASTWMIYLVGNITSYAKSLKPDIIIVANMGGGLPLLLNDRFLMSIDVVLEEEVWYCEDEPLSSEDTEWALEYLDYAVEHGKEVIVLDYAWTKENVLDDASKAVSKGYYVYVASTYELNTLSPYIPSYSGLAYTSDPKPVIAWSYHGISNSEWLIGYDVYVSFVANNNALENPIRISSNNSDDVFPSIAYSSDENKLLIVWQTDEGSHEELEVDKHWWIKGVFIDPNTRSILGEVKIGVEENDSLLYPCGVYYNGLFYVFYASGSLEDIENRDIYYAIVDPDSGEVREIKALTKDGNYNDYPRAIATPNGVAVTWFSNDGLYLALINDNSVVWKKLVDDSVERERYTILYADELGIVVLYQKGISTKMKVYDLSGECVREEENLPPITWMPHAINIDDVVVYTTLEGIVLLWYDNDHLRTLSISSLASVSGIALGYNRDERVILVYTPGHQGNNTIDIGIVPLYLVSKPPYTTTVTKTLTETLTETTTVTTTKPEVSTKTIYEEKTSISVIALTTIASLIAGMVIGFLARKYIG